MAAFTSTQNGDWDDGATWGNDSPGDKGTDWPGLVGDTFSCGHTVTYNVSETNELGDSVITSGGILTFKTDADTKITFGNNILTINDDGEYRMGANGAVIDAAQTAELVFNTTSDNLKGITVYSGGKFMAYGDPAYYGSDGETTLANDADNTDDDADVVTSDDMSAKWNVGDEITIKREKLGDSTTYRDAVVKYTIQNIVGTKITLDVNFVGYTAGIGDTWEAVVVNVTRNVKIYKLGADTVCGDGSDHWNTNRPVIVITIPPGETNVVISNTIVTGFYSVGGDRSQLLDTTYRNAKYGMYYGTGKVFTGNMYQVERAFYYGDRLTVDANIYMCRYSWHYGYKHVIDGNIFACSGPVQGTKFAVSANIYGCRQADFDGRNCVYTGNMYLNDYAFYNTFDVIIHGNIYANTNGMYYVSKSLMTGRIGYDSNDVSQPNGVDFALGNCGIHILLNVKLPLAGLTVTRNDSNGQEGQIWCEHHDRTLNAQRIYDMYGNVTKVACDGGGDRPSEDPDGGNSDVIEFGTVQSNCSTLSSIKAWKEFEYRIWASAAVGAKTYTFKVQTTYAGITAGGLKLTATYLDGVSAGSTDEEIHAPVINERANASDWTQTLAVTVTPQEDGWIDFMVELMEYQSGDEVYIWPEVAIT